MRASLIVALSLFAPLVSGVFWDAIEHPSLYTSQTKHGGTANPFVLPQFTALWVGRDEYQPATQKFEMWLDEVAVDGQRIGWVL